MISLEHPDLRCRRIDLDAIAEDEARGARLVELLAASDEDDMAWRGGLRYTPRLAPWKAHPAANALPDGDYRLARPAEKTLDQLVYVSHEARPPGPHEIQIRVHASFLNFPRHAQCSGHVSGGGR